MIEFYPIVIGDATGPSGTGGLTLLSVCKACGCVVADEGAHRQDHQTRVTH